jgi:hypothetical protein
MNVSRANEQAAPPIRCPGARAFDEPIDVATPRRQKCDARAAALFPAVSLHDGPHSSPELALNGSSRSWTIGRQRSVHTANKWCARASEAVSEDLFRKLFEELKERA